MRIGVDMGHSLSGAGTGAGKYLVEVEENRKVGKALIAMLEEAGHTIVNCTVDYANTQDLQLAGIVKNANNKSLDLFVSIHFNACEGGHGTETYVYSSTSKALEKAKAVNDEIVKSCNFSNRGVKYSTSLFVLRKTDCPAMLVEVCFVDSLIDKAKYDYNKVAKAMYKGITGNDYIEPVKEEAVHVPTDEWKNTEIKRYKESGVCYPNTTLNIRTLPSTKTGTIVGKYYNGEKVNYDLVVLTNAHVWISWISGAGNRRYMAIKDRISGERWGKCV